MGEKILGDDTLNDKLKLEISNDKNTLISYSSPSKLTVSLIA